MENTNKQASFEDVVNAQQMVMPEPEPIVKEEDFPKPQGRLAEIRSKYLAEHPQAAMAPKSESRLANVEVSNEVTTRSFEELNAEQQQIVAAKISGVDYMASAPIQTFGSAKESTMTKQADVIISKYSANDVDEIASPLTDLVATLKTNNTKKIVERVSADPNGGGVLATVREIFSMKDARKRMAKALAEHSSIKKNIDEVLIELEKQQLSLRTDIGVYEQMRQATYEQVEAFEYDCIALLLMIEEANERLNAYVAKGKLNLTEINEAKQLEAAIDRMNRRLYTIQLIRTSTIQNLPQLEVLIHGNEIICEKIDEIKTLVIPMWMWQYAIAAGAIQQRSALAIQKSVRGITSELITGNAKMLHDNMIAAHKELYEAAVAVEDLAIVQDSIDDMVSQVNTIKKDASKKYVAGMQTCKQIVNKNYKLLTEGLETAAIES